MSSIDRRPRPLTLILAAAIVLATASAQAARPRIYAIAGARIVTAPGKIIENGTLVMRDGLIEAAGADITVPADAEVIRAEAGWSVYPAMIDAASTIGLDTDESAAPARGGPGRGGAPPQPRGVPNELSPLHPEARAIDAIDTGSDTVRRHREMGFGVAHVLPPKGVFRGESAVIALRDGPPVELVVRPVAGEVIALETSSFMARQYPSSKFGAVAAVRQAFLDAGRQGEWNERFAANPAGMQPPEYRASDAVLLKVLRGELLPVFVALTALDPGRFRTIADEFHLGGIVVARGLGDRADNLRAAGMPVLLPLEFPDKPDVKDADALIETDLEQMQAVLRAKRLPLALGDAGVDVAFVTYGMKNPRAFAENLAALVKAGFSPDKALAAVTTTPARLLGLDREMGTLERGKQANAIVVAGDLFVDKPVLRHVFVQGYHEEIEQPKQVGDPDAVVDPRGRWSVTTTVMGRTSESTWTITGAAGAYTGYVESARAGKRDFTSVDLQGNALTVVSAGPSGELKATVVVTGDTLAGDSTMESPRGSVTMKFAGRRIAPPEGRTP